MLLTDKILVGNFTNGRDQGAIYKVKCNDYNFNINCIMFEVKNNQIGNLMEYDLDNDNDNDIIEYHIKKQLSWLYCNNDSIINNIDMNAVIL